jgi:hypothetical protein
VRWWWLLLQFLGVHLSHWIAWGEREVIDRGTRFGLGNFPARLRNTLRHSVELRVIGVEVLLFHIRSGLWWWMYRSRFRLIDDIVTIRIFIVACVLFVHVQEFRLALFE